VAGDLPWRLQQMPPGFRMSSEGEELMPGNERPVLHLVVSDGLASVSVFIEGPPSAPRRGSDGQGRFGSSFAYSKFVGGHQITAVGEVPAATVQFIAAGVAPATPRVSWSGPPSTAPP
jgi:sigma-E factor negative regulatory protein RseB